MRLDVAMNDAALVRVREAGANLLEIKERPLNRQRPRPREREHVATRKILEHDVVKRRAREIDCGAVSEPVYYIWMTHAIECNRFILKVGDECGFEFGIGRVLKVKIQGFDDDRARRTLGGGVVIRDVDFGVAATSEAFENVVPAVKSTLLKFEFRHRFALIRTLRCNTYRSGFSV